MQALAKASSIPPDYSELTEPIPTHKLLEVLEAFSKRPSRLDATDLTSFPKLVIGFDCAEGDGVVPYEVLEEYAQRFGCKIDPIYGLDISKPDKEPCHVVPLGVYNSVEMVGNVMEWMIENGL
ncbi:hypothetical protein HDV00_010010 [Rhizophlyctis rosea]|nr:hypothetical protein HDV00_010010 [Rhizophlyctis rosea]